MSKSQQFIETVKNLLVKGSLLVKKNLGVRGNLILGGDLISPSGQSLFQPNLLVVTNQEDLDRAVLTSSFVPIIISFVSALSELRFFSCNLYNRHIQVLNLSQQAIRLVVPFGPDEISEFLLPNRNANITVMSQSCSGPAFGIIQVNAPSPGPGPGPCFFNHDLLFGESFVSFANSLATSIVIALITDFPGTIFSYNFNATQNTITILVNDGASPRQIGVIDVRLDGNSVTISTTTLSLCEYIARFPGVIPIDTA